MGAGLPRLARSADGFFSARGPRQQTHFALVVDEYGVVMGGHHHRGLVIHEARTIREAGQVFSFRGFRFEVLRKQRNRILSLKVWPESREDDG